jgi:hypothetical protein
MKRMREKHFLLQSSVFEFLSDILTDLITVFPDARAKSNQQGRRIAQKIFLQAFDNFLD